MPGELITFFQPNSIKLTAFLIKLRIHSSREFKIEYLSLLVLVNLKIEYYNRLQKLKFFYPKSFILQQLLLLYKCLRMLIKDEHYRAKN